MLSDSALIQMSFLLQHLEERWSLKKRKHTYIMKRMNGSGSKKSYTSSYLDAHLSALAAPPSSLKQIQLLTFLHNALEDGWNIKKHSHAPNKFTFMKRHNGECTVYEDDEYLTRFIKANLRMETWTVLDGLDGLDWIGWDCIGWDCIGCNFLFVSLIHSFSRFFFL